MPSIHDAAHWATYNDAQANRAVRPLCREVLDLAGPGEGRQAVDLGCGAGRETAAMLEAGWRVHAVDNAPGTDERVLAATGGSAQDLLTLGREGFSELRRLPRTDLLYAGYSLPYAGPADFARLWRTIRASLRPGAWLAVNLFGVRDSWADRPGTFLTEREVHDLLAGLDVVSLVEEDEDGLSFSGPKHWHVFDVMACAPA